LFTSSLKEGRWAAVTVSMRVMSAGDGYKYLLRTVAAGDGDRDLSRLIAFEGVVALVRG